MTGAPVTLTKDLRAWDLDGEENVEAYLDRPDVDVLGGESFVTFQAVLSARSCLLPKK